MKILNHIFLLAVAGLLSACGNDGGGSSNAPDIPADPDGTRTYVMEPGKGLSLDGSTNNVTLDEGGCMKGENLFFSTAGKRDGLIYVTRVPTSPWNKTSDRLKAGYGYVMGSKVDDGALFTRLFVDKVDSLSGRVNVRCASPFYGDGDKFYFNHKVVYMFSEPGDTTLVLTKPTTYNVSIASGEWVSAEPHITYVKLRFAENRSGNVRIDTLLFSNGVFKDVIVPVVQLNYSSDMPLAEGGN